MRSLKRILFIIFVLILLAIVYFVFAPAREIDESRAQGDIVYHNYPPQRIVSCMPSITEMLFAIGVGDRVVGVTLNCNYPPAAKKIEKVGRETMNIEKIISLEPDLVFALKSAQTKDITKIQRKKIPLRVINPRNIKEIVTSVRDLGRATGHTIEAEALASKMMKKLYEIDNAILGEAPQNVVVIVGMDPLFLAGSGTFIHDVISYAGGKNLAAKARGPWPQYSLEQLIIDDPDAIIIAKGVAGEGKEIYNDSRWRSLRAVKHDRVLVIDADLISRPGPRIVDAVEQIARFLHKL